MDFIMKVVAPLAKMNPSFMHNSHALDLLEGACSSKLAIIDNAGDMVTVGEFIEDDGVLYSNTTYLSTYSRWSYYGSLFSGPEYEERYGIVGDLTDSLPWVACQDCPNAEYCAMDYPECESEQIARKMLVYLEDFDEAWDDDEVLVTLK